MKSYKKLLNYLEDSCLGTEVLTFDEIYRICGERVDTDFIDSKSTFERYGFSIKKINTGNRTVLFSRNA